jgi:hypothetical protein
MDRWVKKCEQIILVILEGLGNDNAIGENIWDKVEIKREG